APEGWIAAKLLFHKQALALVHSHAAGTAKRPVAPLMRQVLLIKRMACLVQHAHQCGEKIAGLVSRGDANVAWYAAAKRVMGNRQAAMREVETDSAHHRQTQSALMLDRIGAGQGLALPFRIAGGLDLQCL